jgi:hypothetical protein
MGIDRNLPEWKVVDLRVLTLRQKRAAFDVEEMRVLRDADRVRVHRELGLPTILAYIELRFGYDPHTGSEHLRVAKALEHLPKLEKASETTSSRSSLCES